MGPRKSVPYKRDVFYQAYSANTHPSVFIITRDCAQKQNGIKCVLSPPQFRNGFFFDGAKDEGERTLTPTD